MTTGSIFDIRRYSVHDGPGIRTAVFLKGCPARCLWCHNPEGQSFKQEVMYWPGKCRGCGVCALMCPSKALIMEHGRPAVVAEVCTRCGKCVEVCLAQARSIVGREMSVPEVMDEVELDRAFYDESGGGVTFTGGEPLAQPKFLCELAKACRDLELHTAVDTSGIAGPQVIEELVPHVDLWLYDIKTVDSDLHISATGCSNELPISNLSWLVNQGCDVMLRVPLIPGFNDDDSSLAGFVGLLESLDWRHPAEVAILPYHRLGNEKYARLGRKYSMRDVGEPGIDCIDRARRIFEAAGIGVRIGG
ncbi:MAG: glycyl-radical enzyme activating protein [Firmicutes bacterium]|nr:glycyl-radical enzyme activating protein [Bacillota bacterium]